MKAHHEPGKHTMWEQLFNLSPSGEFTIQLPTLRVQNPSAITPRRTPSQLAILATLKTSDGTLLIFMELSRPCSSVLLGSHFLRVGSCTFWANIQVRSPKSVPATRACLLVIDLSG
jgi:hypothetical protein